MTTEMFIVFTYYPINAYWTYSDVLSFIPDFGSLCLLSFSFQSSKMSMNFVVIFKEHKSIMVKEHILYNFNSFKFVTVYDPRYGLSWWKLYVHLKRIHILLLGGLLISIRYSWLMVFFYQQWWLFKPAIPYSWFSVLLQSVTEWGVWSPQL